jgi:glycosyltransferase involved in cell wall biosynthesis
LNISFYTVKDNLDTTRGYGQAGFNVVRALQKLGHTVPFDDEESPVQFSFCQPAWYKFYPHQYKIGYTPWESTELPSGWTDFMNDCDEVWATSEWVANVYRNCGVKVPVKVFEHGLDEKWSPVRRQVDGVVKFLHVGEPALRKGGQMAIDAFRAVFGDREDVHLTVKAYHQHWLRTWKDGEHVNAKDSGYNNVTIIDELLHAGELQQMYADHHCLVYPSYGEGFGFIPLQALGTGMPVISTYEWASYSKYINLPLSGRWDRSIWTVHPGNVLYPNYEHLKVLFEVAHHDIDRLLAQAYANAPSVHADYNWVKNTEKAFEHLVQKF